MNGVVGKTGRITPATPRATNEQPSTNNTAFLVALVIPVSFAPLAPEVGHHRTDPPRDEYYQWVR